MAQKFVYMASGQEVILDDPTDSYTPQQIKDHWTTTFPELSNAIWEEKRTEDGTKVVTFAKKVGVKGVDGPAWVSVKERLPEDDQIVIVFCPDWDRSRVGYYCKDNDFQSGWILLEGGKYGFADWPVTHWMPLPPPPTEAVQ